MATIPFSQVVSVVPSVLSAGGIAVDLNGLMLTQNAYAPVGQVLQFSTAASVSSYFGASSTEAALASVYFNGFTGCTKLPGNLLFARYPETAISGFLRSASLASMSLATLQSLSGTLSVTVGGTVYTSSAISLTGVASFSAAAAVIQAAFTSPPFSVVFDSTTSAFIFTTTATGSAATITYATGTLSAGLFLTQATGAVLSQGAAAATPAAFMAGILLLTQNWSSLMTVWESALSEKEAFATWVNSVAPRFWYVCQDSDINVGTVANSTEPFGYYVTQNSLAGVTAVYGTAYHAAFCLGFAASLDFNRLNGRATLDFKSQPGLVPYVTDPTTYGNVLSNGYNTFAAFGSNNPGNNSNWFGPGSVSGTFKWVDTYLNQIWLNANLQLALVNLLTSVNSVPYNNQGYGLIQAAALGPINAAINFGAIRKGVVMSASQVAQMQFALGFDASAAVTSRGYYLYIAPAPATTRAARQSPPISCYYQDGESVQQINLASIVVQ